MPTFGAGGAMIAPTEGGGGSSGPPTILLKKKVGIHFLIDRGQFNFGPSYGARYLFSL